MIEVHGNKGYQAFLNTYNKGYQAKLVTYCEGEQLVLQSDFAESNKHFSRSQILQSASVATDRGGNEHAVNVPKRAWFLKMGFQKKNCRAGWLSIQSQRQM